jgi:hypothetical protein
MAEFGSFLRDWTLFLLIEAGAVVLFFAVYALLRRRSGGKTVLFIRVEVFLRPSAAESYISGSAILQANFFRDATRLESAIHRLGGEVTARPGVGRPMLARLPSRSLPKLTASDLVERVEPARTVAFEIGPRR